MLCKYCGAELIENYALKQFECLICGMILPASKYSNTDFIIKNE